MLSDKLKKSVKKSIKSKSSTFTSKQQQAPEEMRAFGDPADYPTDTAEADSEVD